MAVRMAATERADECVGQQGWGDMFTAAWSCSPPSVKLRRAPFDAGMLGPAMSKGERLI